MNAPASTRRPRALRPRSREEVQALVRDWNAAHPSGTAVAVRRVAGGKEYCTTTRSAAWASATNEPWVMVTGRDGGWPLDLVRPLKLHEVLDLLPAKDAGAADGGDPDGIA